MHTDRPSAQSKLDGVQVWDGAPHLSDQTFLRDVDVAEVKCVVDGLHLPHFDEPHPHGLRGSLQHPLTMVLCLVQHLKAQCRGGWFLFTYQTVVAWLLVGHHFYHEKQIRKNMFSIRVIFHQNFIQSKLKALLVIVPVFAGNMCSGKGLSPTNPAISLMKCVATADRNVLFWFNS